MFDPRPRDYWDTIVKPQRGWFDINWKELYRYKDLIWLLIKRNFTLIYKQTILGPAWVLIQPIITSFIFTLIFGIIAGLPTDGVPSFLFYMCGHVAWNYFAQCLTTTSTTFVTNRNLFGKVYFPRLAMPISTVLSQLINFLAQYIFFIIVLAFYLIFKDSSNLHPNYLMMLWTPLILLQMAMLGLGLGIIVSALTTKYRDLALLVSFGVNLWMYATPVAYSSSMIRDKFPELMGVYMLNPMTPLIELFRQIYLGVQGFELKYYLISIVTTLVIFALGIMLFSRTEKTFMDTV